VRCVSIRARVTGVSDEVPGADGGPARVVAAFELYRVT